MLYPGVPRIAAPKVSHGRFKGQDKTFMGMEMLMQITYGVDLRLLVSKRNVNRHLREINGQVIRYWHKHFRPGHFTTPGFSKYKYQRRTNATVEIKKKAYGHNLPIVQKGAARSLTGHIKNVRTTPTMAKLKMMGPWYLGHRQKRKKGGLSPDLKAELTRVDQADALKLARIGGGLMKAALKADKKKRLGAHVRKSKT